MQYIEKKMTARGKFCDNRLRDNDPSQQFFKQVELTNLMRSCLVLRVVGQTERGYRH